MKRNFRRVRSVKDIIITVTLIAAGLLCIILPTSVSINIIGATLFFVGFMMTLVLKTGYKDTTTGQLYKKKEMYFSKTRMENILRMLEEDPENIDLSNEGAESSLRLDIFYNKDRQVFVQLSEYVPYQYETCSDFIEVSPDKSGKFFAC